MPVILSFKNMLKQIRNNPMFIFAFISPIIFGVVFKYFIPILEAYLTNYFNVEKIISPYYIVIDIFLYILTPFMICFVSAMFMLEEIDDKVVNYFAVTPLGKNGYIISRFILFLIISFFITTVLVFLFSITHISLVKIIIISFIGSLQGFIYSLLIVSFSKNKLEGVAVSKLSSILMLGVLASFFIKGKYKYFFSLFPSFWFAESVKNSVYIPLCIFISFLWINFLLKKFYKKIF